MNVLEGLFDFDAPGHPSTPFGDGVLGFDILRLVILACTVALLVLSVAAVTVSPKPAQQLRIVATAVFAFVTAGTELAHLGDEAHWRLYANFAATALAAWGMWLFLRYETPGAGAREEARHSRKLERRARRHPDDTGRPIPDQG